MHFPLCCILLWTVYGGRIDTPTTEESKSQSELMNTRGWMCHAVTQRGGIIAIVTAAWRWLRQIDNNACICSHTQLCGSLTVLMNGSWLLTELFCLLFWQLWVAMETSVYSLLFSPPQLSLCLPSGRGTAYPSSDAMWTGCLIMELHSHYAGRPLGLKLLALLTLTLGQRF